MEIVNALGKRVIALDHGQIVRDVERGSFKNIGGQKND